MSKLQDLADALAKADPDGNVQIVDHTTYTGGAPEKREVVVMSGGQTAGFLHEASAGRWSFTAPDDAKFNDVAGIVAVLDEENVKLGATE